MLFIGFLFESIFKLLGALIYSSNPRVKRKLSKDANQVFTGLFPWYVLLILAFFTWIFSYFYRKHFGLFGSISDTGNEGVFRFGTFLFENASLLIAIVSAIILVLTFVSHLRESKKQNFRTNFFEYLKIHRENTGQIETRGKKGHDAFVDIYNELNFVYQHFPEDTRASSIHRIEWSYVMVFYGLGETSTPITKSVLQKYYVDFHSDIEVVVEHYEKLRRHFNQEKSSNKKRGTTFLFKKPTSTAFANVNLACVLDGHQSDLGHYFRHLFQTVTFIDQFPSLWAFEKYDYVKNVRAQFSNHELAIFLANAYAPLGKIWMDQKLIDKYELIKNLPLSLFPWKSLREDFPKIEFEV